MIEAAFGYGHAYPRPNALSVTMLSDIFPTGYFGADNAEIDPGDTVAVFGCGPVGQFAIASARLMDTGRVFAIDTIPSRLDRARGQGAECIDFNAEDPVQVLRELTGGPDPIVSLMQSVSILSVRITARRRTRRSNNRNSSKSKCASSHSRPNRWATIGTRAMRRPRRGISPSRWATVIIAVIFRCLSTLCRAA